MTQSHTLSTSSTQLTVETGFLWECLLNLWLITEGQLNEALSLQKEYREQSNLSKPIWEILSELCGISIEKIESIFVKEQLIFWIKRLVRDILHGDGIINKRIDNWNLPSLKENFSEESIEINIPCWEVNCTKTLYFKQEDWVIKTIKNPNYTIDNIRWKLELIIDINGDKIKHEKKDLFYSVSDKKINISPMEILSMIRTSFLGLYLKYYELSEIEEDKHQMGSID
ncbi:MAG: hypothetical protein ACD_49C00085G0009 [uncultured bacterium (gcode 4)]|uniref:Uncharacterized protein n=1 Tax=uncultured bacterium (gcode 4) TaxID=1234023 RepID=K2BU94_9BACT|nr:MAG: hypothetical protein ACD_49C00085G0009 [uncultured bacterium (gcode 4)]